MLDWTIPFKRKPSPQESKDFLMTLFGDSHEYKRDFTYRCDEDKQALIVRTSYPLQEIFPHMTGVSLPEIEQGSDYAFDVVCVPMKSQNGGKKKPVKEEEAAAWLAGVLKTRGWEMVSATVNRQKHVVSSGRKKIHLNETHISGMMRVLDVGKAQLALQAGIGDARCYGYGQLMIETP